MTFRNREEAASLLARELVRYRGQNPLILAIPRGAVPMARIIADALGGEADVVLVRKLRAPSQKELAIGSIDEHGHTFLTEYARALGVSHAYLEKEKREQMDVLQERRRRYTEARPPVDPAGRIVIVVDDGIATGSTMIAALKSIREKNPARLIAAAAVAPSENVERIRPYADQVVCLETPRDFYAVGQFFEDFSQVEDEEVLALLKESAARNGDDPEVSIPVDGRHLPGNLTIPHNARGLIVFAHGSGSSRLSPRNRYVADVLNQAGFATLLFDLLTPAEDEIYETRFDIPLLARRLATTTEWLAERPDVKGLPLGYFGASTGAAAALIAAAEMGGKIRAVVSRGGRPDLAMDMLPRVKSATLLIVGGWDDVVIGMNERAYDALPGIKDLAIVPNATHLFEEPGKLEEAARLAVEWFLLHMTSPRRTE